MKSKNFIHVSYFIDKYDLNKNSFKSMKAQGYFPKKVFDYSDGRRGIKIDDNYFLHRKDRIEQIKDRAYRNYSILSEKFLDYQIAKILFEVDSSKSINAWLMFLRNNLFTSPSERIINTFLAKGIYKFIRASNKIIKTQ